MMDVAKARKDPINRRLAQWSALRIPEAKERYDAAVGWAIEYLEVEYPRLPITPERALKLAAALFDKVVFAGEFTKPTGARLEECAQMADDLRELAAALEVPNRRETHSAEKQLIADTTRLVALHFTLPLTSKKKDTPLGFSASDVVSVALDKIGRKTIKPASVGEIENSFPGREELLWMFMPTVRK